MKLTHLRTRLSVRLLAGTAFAAAICAAQPAAAATDDDTMDVTATVTSNCEVSAGTLAFGNVDVTSGANTDNTATLSVTCTTGTDWDADADVGLGDGATLAVRRMTDGDENTLDYVLYTDAGRTTVWGDGTASTALISSTGTGSAQNSTIYGRVPLGQTGNPAGAYTDTVTVTVTY